jgi:hypothetical protein
VPLSLTRLLGAKTNGDQLRWKPVFPEFLQPAMFAPDQ